MSTNFHIDTGNPITLWCTPHSLYSGKVRSYLIKKGLPYRELLPANPTSRKTWSPRWAISWCPSSRPPTAS